MNLNTISSALASLLLGLLIASHHNYLTGVNPLLIQFVMAILLGIVLINIYRSRTNKEKLVHVLILSIALIVGAKIMVDSAEQQLEGYIRKYDQIEEKK